MLSRYTHMCSRCTHVCAFREHMIVIGRTRVCVCMRVLGVHICVFACTHMCVPRVHICVFPCAHMRVPRVHVCVFTCAHMCVPTGHVFVFQENTCMLSDEPVCVCAGLLRVHMYVCSFVHICVFHVYTFVLHVYTHVCSNWPRVCVLGEYMFVMCVARVHRRVFTCTHICVPTTCFTGTRVCVCVSACA